MSAAHTPGPLTVRVGANGDVGIIVSAELISTYRWHQSTRNPKRVVDMVHRRETANRSIPNTVAVCESAEHARLIAAAPDLLEALKRCRFDSLNMSFADLAFCRAAYVKATGQQGGQS